MQESVFVIMSFGLRIVIFVEGERNFVSVGPEREEGGIRDWGKEEKGWGRVLTG